MAAQIYYPPFIPAFSSNGAPVAGAMLNFYVSGTSMRTPVFADDALTIPLPNPVVADGSGKYPNVFLDEAIVYRVVQTGPDGLQLGDEIDPYVPGQALKGDPGPTGPADNTYTTLAALLASDKTRKKANLVGDPVEPDGPFNVVDGAWVRQGAEGITTQAPGGVVQNTGDRLNRTYLTPEDYGAVGYATLEEAQVAATDSTAAMQALFDACVDGMMIANGNDRWYRVGTVRVPSGLTAMNVRTFSVSSAVDNAPFDFSYLPAGVIRDVTLVACGGHGNRANQTALSSSGGDGQRAIFKIWNRTENVQMLGCFAWHAATDGIWVWHANVDPANGTDYCHRDLVIQDPDVQWNGRHGISLSSVYRCRVSANGRGFLANNGRDLPGATGGSYADGKYGRKLNGILYGRGITFESFVNGDGFDTLELSGLDCRGNVSGALLLHVRHATPCYRLRITGCQFDDPQGAVGDGALITTATNAATGNTYAGSDGFVDVALAGNTYGRNAPFLRNIFGLTVSDTYSSVDPAVSVFGFNIGSTVANVAYFSCPSNRAISGLVSPITVKTVTQYIGTGWTATAGALDLLGFTVTGKLSLHVRVMVTSDAGELGAFDVVLPDGWTDITDARASGFNNDTGDPLTLNVQRSPNVAEGLSFSLRAVAPHVHVIDLYFTAARP